MIADSGVAAVFETARNNMDTSAEEVSVLARVQAHLRFVVWKTIRIVADEKYIPQRNIFRIREVQLFFAG